jgi:hypothetical protein
LLDVRWVLHAATGGREDDRKQQEPHGEEYCSCDRRPDR